VIPRNISTKASYASKSAVAEARLSPFARL
jgi:hypothetical protein